MIQENSLQEFVITKVTENGITTMPDLVTIETALGIEILYSTSKGLMRKNLAVTMRTPGNDEELIAGFLFTEGIVNNQQAIAGFKKATGDNNKIQAILKEGVLPVLSNTERNFYVTSSCGICGKASIEQISSLSAFSDIPDACRIQKEKLLNLPSILRDGQLSFSQSGGIHACGLFYIVDETMLIREDVGRHNALDKLIGTALLQQKLPLLEHILLLSGRASFELIQKAVMAGIRIVAAVGAPSSLAIELAIENQITLVGFLRDRRFNIYSCPERIILN